VAGKPTPARLVADAVLRAALELTTLQSGTTKRAA
jgi:hypothetical protein